MLKLHAALEQLVTASQADVFDAYWEAYDVCAAQLAGSIH